MYFLLRSEIEIRRNNFCPYCYKAQIKKLDRTELYTKYKCWNKSCEKKDVPFIIINEYINDEEFFEPTCESCQTPLIREFKIDDNHNIYLSFKCEGKMCELYSNPFLYNLTLGKWEENIPKFKVYEDQLVPIRDIKKKKKKLS